ncbi:MFS transporter, DHA1 family, arabinose polymer transporter [Mesonia phycicola]|uniref:MFS transporter, DHA1 family, arabinose polymer transporter n=1 Tax=Mesonia phycicola TaxID=579105 RepID=A0A1M6CKW9_9FLAO|nr:MFS transporter [Mesonia phycicola]SHI61666.1 MFS transporter, DHA1 family, arabinose polymer transporter [Mesonia phycicola]
MNIQKSLITLAIGGFGIGMTEFMMMGLLPDIAQDLNVTIPEAGYLISSYALGVVIGAPLLVLIAGSFSPKKILIGLMVLFTVFNGLSIIVPSYNFFLFTRLLSGLPHGAFFGVGAVVAGKLAKEGKEASAVAIMFSGLTFANIIGIPLGTYVGQAISWRYSFIIVAAIGLLAILSLIFWMPSIEKNTEEKPKDGLKVFLHLEPWLVLLTTAIGTGGFFAWFSYITPLLTDVSGFEKSSITFILMGVGVGMTVGNFAGGKLADVISPVKAGMVLLFVMVLCLLTVMIVAENQLLSLIMSFVTGAVAFSVVAPIQMLMIKSAKGAEMLASAAMQAGFNIGNAIGAFLGGIPIARGLGYTSPQAVGAVMAFMGALFCIAVMINRKRVAKKYV